MKKVIFTLLIGFITFISYGQNDFVYTPIQITRLASENSSIPQLLQTSETSSMPESLKTSENFTLASKTSSFEDITETPAELSVSPTGGAIYNIPIAVPPGINGVKPSIALTYNSQAGNGLAGYGWNISGVSIISRIPSTKFHDNNSDPVDFDSWDRFALDGKRLILKSGSYGKHGAQYETETFSNLKVISYGVSPYGAEFGPAYFTVAYPDGSMAYYGNTGNSRSHMDYAIAYWQDPQGNRITYSYTLSGNSLSIQSIKYGAMTTAAPINEIQFIYTNRNRSEQSYINGISFSRTTILREIRMTTNGVGFKTYRLYHQPNFLGYDRLTGVSELSGDLKTWLGGIRLIFFDTDKGVSYNGAFAKLNVNNIQSNNTSAIAMDLSGKGNMDLIVYPETGTDARKKIWLYKGINAGYNYATEIKTAAFETVFPVTWVTHNNKVLAGQGISLVQKSGVDQVKFKVYSDGTVSPLYYQYEKVWKCPTLYLDSDRCDNRCNPQKAYKEIPKIYINADFNGDGLTDVIAIEKSFKNKFCTKTALPIKGCLFPSMQINRKGTYFIDLDRRKSSGFANASGELKEFVTNEHKFYTGDANGDGKSDLFQVLKGKVYVYTLNQKNILELLYQVSDTYIDFKMPFLLGDYNGDGKTDFLIPQQRNTNSFVLYLGTGKGFDRKSRGFPFTYKPDSQSGSTVSGNMLIPTDINGDGRTDILEYNTATKSKSADGKQTISVYQNQVAPNGQPTVMFYLAGKQEKQGNLTSFPLPVFFPGTKPNNNLLFGVLSGQYIHSFKFNKDQREEMLLRRVERNGRITSITYGDLDDSSTDREGGQVYATEYSETLPYINVSVSRGTKLVSKLERSCRAGCETTKQFYHYYGAVSHLDGLGFLGFKGIAASNWFSDVKDRQYKIVKQDPHLRGAIVNDYLVPNTYNFNSVPSNYISKTTNTYQSSLGANKVFRIKNTMSVSQNNLEGTTTTQSYTYDNYDNPLKITTNYSGQGSVVIDMTYYNNTGSPYVLGRPLKKVMTSTVGSEIFGTEEQYIYSGHLLTQLKTKGKDTGFNTVLFGYDGYGNTVKKTTNTHDGLSRSISYGYDSSGRFLTKTTDAEGLTSLYEYNQVTGMLVKETNPYGQQTRFEYDTWGNLLKSTDYLGKSVTTSASSNPWVDYTITEASDDGSTRISTYDNQKRLVKVQEKDVMNQWVSKSYKYDALNRVIAESEPYTEAPSQWNTVEYDTYGRIKKQTAFTGKAANISYSGLSNTVNDGTKSVTVTKDAMGNVVKMIDPGGTVTYTYFGNGNMKTANYEGSQQVVEQDGWGRKTKLTDPTGGVYTYSYNGYGELVKETTPKGSTNYEINGATGKLMRKIIAGDDSNLISAYAYDSSTKLLTGITLTNGDGNNSTYSYTYDANKRPVSVQETGAYAKFSKWFTYDDFGRVATEESEARLLANNKFTKKKIRKAYVNGQLKSVEDAASGELLWNIAGLNARGQVTSKTMGVNLRTSNSYDAYGYVNQIKTEKNINALPAEVMKLTYKFNVQRGLLESRSNSMFSWNENFTYDSMDRLLSFNDNSGNKTHAYDSRGRITNNSQLGTYAYDGKSYREASMTLNAFGEAYFKEYTAQKITYNAFKSPVEIDEAGKERISFQYNAFEGRANMFYGGTQPDKLQRRYRKHYAHDGSMEITHDTQTGKITFVTFMGGDAYNAPAIWHSQQSNTTSEQYLYLNRDYLGSILSVMDKNGALKEKRHFDAWGNIVKLTDGNNNNLTTFAILDRGYTGHEHLGGVRLIHMNGRLYDPGLHRFLMPDNFVQDPYNTQNFNRYGYVLNNPLMYTDPSGEFFWVAVGIGALIGAITQAIKPGATFGSILGGALLGAAAGMIGAGVGNVVAGGSFFGSQLATTIGFGSGFVSGFAGGFAGGFVGAAGNAWLGGANFGEGLLSGLKGGAVGGIAGGLINGISSGIRANKIGLDFWSGEGTIDSHYVSTVHGEGAPVEYSNESAKNFSDSHEELKRLSKNIDNIYADGSHPEGYSVNNGRMYNSTGRQVAGVTSVRKSGWLGLGNKINVYLAETAFGNRGSLYMVMHHEYMHAYFGFHGMSISSIDQHRIINQWHVDQMQAWGWSIPKDYSSLVSRGIFGAFRFDQPNMFFDYNFFGFRVINYKP